MIDESGFVSFRDWRIRIRFVSWITNPSCFQKIRFVDSFRRLIFKRFDLFLRILSTIARNESLKIKIRKSESLRIFKVRIRKSGFVNPNPKDLYRGFVSWIHFWKIRFVDSFRANKNLKLLDSFRFVRIRIRIPHPYLSHKIQAMLSVIFMLQKAIAIYYLFYVFKCFL